MPIKSHEFPNCANLEALIQSPALSRQEKQGLKSYKDKIDEQTKDVLVEYSVERFGRFTGYAKKGKFKTYTTGTSMKRVIRNLVLGDEYDDLDISNASGNIMCQLFEKHGLNTDKMSYLNDNREEVLETIMNFQDQKVERATAKDIMIEVFFCGTGHTSQYWELNPFTNKKDTILQYCLPPFVEELRKEYLHNLNIVVDLPDYKDIKDYVIQKAEDKGGKAWIGQFASMIYQDEERKVLEVMVDEINAIAKERKIEKALGSLIYDGLHVRKSLEIRNYIKRLEKTISKKTDYCLKLEIKDMDVSDEERKKYLGDKPPMLTYEAKKTVFELKSFKTKKGKLPFHTIDTKDGIISRDKGSFTVAFEDWTEDGVDFLKEWYADPHKRSYNEIEYSCIKEEDHLDSVYYAFPTLRYKTLASTSTEQEKQANIEYFNDYIMVLVEDNKDYVKWMTYWLADLILNPDTKGDQPIACIFWSPPGSGKTSLRNFYERVLGEKLVHHTDDPTKNGDILHEFNSTLKFKLFIEFEEINMKTHSKVVDNIKALVTNHTHSITHKGQDTVDVKASERFIFTTNNASSAVIEKGDRRYCAFATSKRRVGDTNYWKGFYSKLKDDNFIKDISDYLLSFKEEVSHYAFRDERPMTSYYKSLIQLSLPAELDFLKDLFFYHKEEIAGYITQVDMYTIGSSILSEQYNTWRQKHGLEGKVTGKSFTMKMKSHGDVYGITHKQTSSHNVFIIDSKLLCNKLVSDFSITPDQAPSMDNFID